MRWGIFSDIHSNLEAFQAVLEAFAGERIDRYLFVGDIVGYGASPRECIEELRRLDPVSIAGNHDWAAVELLDTIYFNPHARAAVLWTSQNITNKDKEFLRSLELVSQQERLTLVHGSLCNPEQFRYIFDIPSAEETFALMQTKICFIGHSHVPVIFIKEGRSSTFTFQTEIRLKNQWYYIVNTGSVGQPRDGNPKACYVIYDTESEVVRIKRISYDIRRAQDKIIEAGLPRILAERLSLGR